MQTEPFVDLENDTYEALARFYKLHVDVVRYAYRHYWRWDAEEGKFIGKTNILYASGRPVDQEKLRRYVNDNLLHRHQISCHADGCKNEFRSNNTVHHFCRDPDCIRKREAARTENVHRAARRAAQSNVA